jgi:hypothetical protein
VSPPPVVGLANGLAQSLVSLGRFVGPVIGGGVSDRPHNTRFAELNWLHHHSCGAAPSAATRRATSSRSMRESAGASLQTITRHLTCLDRLGAAASPACASHRSYSAISSVSSDLARPFIQLRRGNIIDKTVQDRFAIRRSPRCSGETARNSHNRIRETARNVIMDYTTKRDIFVHCLGISGVDSVGAARCCPASSSTEPASSTGGVLRPRAEAM